VQGFGTAPIFVMVTAQAFVSLPLAMRPEAAALFSLMRNLGASIGIAVMQAYFVRNAQIVHAELAARVMPYNLAQHHPEIAALLAQPDGLARVNALVTQQAEWVSYVSTFGLITVVTVLTIPLILLFRRNPRGAAAPPMAAALAE
jgi:DHA2 family multidrug resistance protein